MVEKLAQILKIRTNTKIETFSKKNVSQIQVV